MICGDCHIYGHTHRPALQYYSTCPSSNKGCCGCNTVTKLERDIEETAKKLTQLLVDLQRAKTEMNYCHSTIIKKLPTEIISTIFENFVANSIDLDSRDNALQADVLPIPLKLSQVCRSWKRIASSTGKIWTTMVISLGLCLDPERVELLQHWMARTKGLPLDISIYIGKSLPENILLRFHTMDPSSENRVLEVLLGTSKQWRNVRLQLPYVIMQALCRRLDNNVNNFFAELTDVRLYEDESADMEGRPWTNFQISPKHVTLTGLGLPLNVIDILWGTVTTAHLKSFYESQCMELFRSAPMLISVTLEDIWENDDGGSGSSQDYSVIQHSTIQHLSCHLYDGVIDIMQWLKLPNLTSLKFNARDTPDTWYAALQVLFAHSACSLERLEMIDHSFEHSLIIRLLNTVPSLQHLRLESGPWDDIEDWSPIHWSPIPFLRHLAETSKGEAFLPSLKTLEYDVENMNFPWQLVPDIFGSSEKNIHALLDQRQLTSFKVINRYKTPTKKALKGKLIPRQILRQLLSLRQRGAEIIYEDEEGKDLFKMSGEPTGGANHKT